MGRLQDQSSGHTRRESTSVQAYDQVPGPPPQPASDWRSTERSNAALWATSNRPSHRGASSSQTLAASGEFAVSPGRMP